MHDVSILLIAFQHLWVAFSIVRVRTKLCGKMADLLQNPSAQGGMELLGADSAPRAFSGLEPDSAAAGDETHL